MSSVSGRVPAVAGLCSVGVRLRAVVLAVLLAIPVAVRAASEPPPEQTITVLPGDVQQRIDPLTPGNEQHVEALSGDGVQHVTEGTHSAVGRAANGVAKVFIGVDHVDTLLAPGPERVDPLLDVTGERRDRLLRRLARGRYDDGRREQGGQDEGAEPHADGA